jgi:hypothetical protein
MKTVLIIVALIHADLSQDMYSYKAVKVRPGQDSTAIKNIDRICDTFTVISVAPYKIGHKIEVDR